MCERSVAPRCVVTWCARTLMVCRSWLEDHPFVILKMIEHVFDNREMVILQAFRFALDPSPVQGVALRSHCGGQRFAYNWGLAHVKANLDQRRAETSYGVD